jgi:hypothetical protein
MLPHVVCDLVPRLGCCRERLWLQFADASRREDRGANVVGREEFEESPDTNPSTEFAFGELHRRLMTEAPPEHGIEIDGQVHRHSYTWWIGKVLDVHIPRTIALGHSTEFVEFVIHPAGHRDVSL